MKLEQCSAVLTAAFLFLNLIQGADLARDERGTGRSGVKVETTELGVSEFWRCPLNVKLNLKRDEILKYLAQVKEEENTKEISKLENALKEIDALREKYYLDSYR